MKKTIEPVNVEASDELIGYIDDLFDDLPKYYDRITGADIYLKVNKEKPVDEKQIEVKAFLPGRDVFAGATGASFEEASRKVFAKIKRQLVEAKKLDRRQNRPKRV